MEKIAEKFAEKLISKNICTEEEKPLYVYGMTLFLTTALVMLSIIALSMLFFDIRYGLLYVIMFPSLRVCVGGYHCKTYLSCFVASNIIFVLDALFAELLWIHGAALSVLLVMAASPYIIIYAPVLNPNNPLTVKRKEKNRKKAIRRTVIMTIVAVICSFAAMRIPALKYVSSTAASVEFTVALLMLIEKIKQKGEKHD